ncbi:MULTISPECIES: histidine phosphatase family protein [Bacillus]|uniref:Phosphoglycerate mutase n=2 Tax=Bacillus cereus group TaxID=86661 RepID=R8QKP4_BACCE|nr:MULTISPECIES: histidine phosphatase family protein [Bacillus cereus group]EOP71023.1 phosphoglycerate mutase [Bacillus cereus VD118]MBJ7985564.1 histidine phosphatase family protein [Bacillus cereus]MBJ8092582.1 histidine phosphatase family protein [Bacillus cereus]OOQ95040.1 histidine phosphatase family protein [Bacillus cereus]CAH2461877.1 phosphoglycerate mutase [Bacillus mycoides KBAB4]
MQILLIRHGESEADILNVHEGRADFELTEKGRQQVQRLVQKVKADFLPDFIWASTLKRARETAETLAEAIQCPIQLEEELMEFNNGVQAGLSFEEAKKYPEPKFLHDRFENGESFIEFRMRIEGIFSKIVTENTYDRIAIVAHGGVINSILRAFFQMPISMDYYFKMGDTGISLIELTDKQKTVHFINDTNHLDGL